MISRESRRTYKGDIPIWLVYPHVMELAPIWNPEHTDYMKNRDHLVAGEAVQFQKCVTQRAFLNGGNAYTVYPWITQGTAS